MYKRFITALISIALINTTAQGAEKNGGAVQDQKKSVAASVVTTSSSKKPHNNPNRPNLDRRPITAEQRASYRHALQDASLPPISEPAAEGLASVLTASAQQKSWDGRMPRMATPVFGKGPRFPRKPQKHPVLDRTPLTDVEKELRRIAKNRKYEGGAE